MASLLFPTAWRAIRRPASLQQFRSALAYSHPCNASTAPAPSLTQPCRTFHESYKRRNDTFTASLEANKIWATDIASKDPEFFKNSAKGQTPDILWIGCCDSRVPETTVLGKKPGEVFVLRNIANVINPTDIALLSSVEFSVKHLKIKHIVLCGHTSCGGVKATLANNKLDILDVWLQPMRQIREKHADALGKMSAEEKEDALARLNVQAGVDNLRRIPTVVDAIKERGLQVHGVLYRLDKGYLEQIDTAEDEHAGACRHSTFELK